MLVEFEFPAVVRAIPARAVNEKLVLCRIPERGEIRVVASEEAPLVAVIHREGGKSRYRAVDGELFAVVGGVSDLRKGVGNKSFLRRTMIEKHLFGIAHDELSSCPRSLVWPENAIDSAYIKPSFQHSPPDIFSRNPKDPFSMLPYVTDVRPTLDGDRDIAVWRHRINIALESVVICDERVWMRVPEPSIALFPQSVGIHRVQGDTAFYSQAKDNPLLARQEAALYWRNIQDVCLPITEWDEAEEFTARHLSWISNPHLKRTATSDIVRVEIHDPSPFRFDFRTAEFRRLADRASYLGTDAMRVPSRPSVWRKNLPQLFVDAINQLDRARSLGLDGLNELEVALENMLHLVRRPEPELSSKLNCDVFAHSLELGLERWQDRPISLESGMSIATSTWSTP